LLVPFGIDTAVGVAVAFWLLVPSVPMVAAALLSFFGAVFFLLFLPIVVEYEFDCGEVLCGSRERNVEFASITLQEKAWEQRERIITLFNHTTVLEEGW